MDCEEKNKERQLFEVNKKKDVLISIISHDLIGPLGSFKNLIDFLLENQNNISKDEIINVLYEVKKSSYYMFDFVENILCWAKSNTIDNQPFKDIINLNEVVSNIEIFFKDIIKNKKIEINKQINKDVLFKSDKNVIETTIRNLISNALKFSNENGKIDIQFSQNNKKIIIDIIDYGKGIEENILEKLKNGELRISTFGTNKEKGSGLGLGLCQEMLQKIGGKMEMQSEYGKGSKFSIIIEQ